MVSEEKSIEDLFKIPKRYAIKFDEKDQIKGSYLLHLNVEGGIRLRNHIFVIEEQYLSLLEKVGLKYEIYEPKTNAVSEIYEHFGVEKPVFKKPLRYFVTAKGRELLKKKLPLIRRFFPDINDKE